VSSPTSSTAQALELSHGQHMTRFLAHASNTRERLPHLARIVIRDRPPSFGIKELIGWLGGRAAVKRKVKILEFRHPCPVPELPYGRVMLNDDDKPLRYTYREKIEPQVVKTIIEPSEERDSETE
jgi:hypothetical protein